VEQGALDIAEANYVALRLRELKDKKIPGSYDFKHLCAIHGYIFQDLYDWAGKPRILDVIKDESLLGGLSIDYARHSEIKREGDAIICGMKSEPWTKLSLEQKAERFSKYFAGLWKVHPFREGNTRAITYFCCQYANESEMPIDDSLFARHSAYLRNALVASNAVFDDLGDKSKPEYLRRIVLDAIQRGFPHTC
jgi:cell filamentation protein